MLLALDTTQASLVLALAADQGVEPMVVDEPMPRGQGDVLFARIADLLAAAGARMADLTRIACAIGPGSFTGVRISVAAARGLALALGVPVAGFSSLEILARTVRDAAGGDVIVAAIASRGGMIFVQPFSSTGAPLAAPALCKAAMAAPGIAFERGVLVGSGARLLAPHLSGWRVHDIPSGGSARALLALARTAPAERWRTPPVPLYLRPPDARPQANAIGAGIVP
ncbi:MAG: tRNA (adenosine(37)-N6)-threonylcarbamoyltransferase complex dimerization subunit type 1 TsaB [Alphaproteobacteria bacterium]|nr:MAG: tRNA (adenosine(37)-N6)-threonylcarbamoyltransferase complex dimerization subunit type 1 TsaB [Alphaproteobacteria bacterium]